MFLKLADGLFDPDSLSFVYIRVMGVLFNDCGIAKSALFQMIKEKNAHPNSLLPFCVSKAKCKTR